MLISVLVADATDALILTTLEPLAGELSLSDAPNTPSPASMSVASRPAARGQVLALLSALLDEAPVRQRNREALYGEALFQIEMLDSLLNGSVSLSSVTTGVAPTTPAAAPMTVESVIGRLSAPLVRLDTIFGVKHMCATGDASATETWAAAQAATPPAPPPPDSPTTAVCHALSRILLPSLERSVYLQFRALALRRMAALALAIRLYQLDHGARPAQLEELVPAYLPAVPRDPFDPNGGPDPLSAQRQLADPVQPRRERRR